MPTGSDRSLSPAHDTHRNGLSTTENGAASPTSSNGQNGQFCGTKMSTITPDPTQYIQRARVTRPAPPKPSCNPMQFVQIKPCNLYQSAQEQLKKTEEVKKVKEIKKEEPEDWQSNLDNWKSSRRKRVEHIIDRVVEVKKLELEEHDRQRRKSKTFSEMMEERGERGRGRNKLASLAVYNEDESNDLSDLGIGTSSASGKSSLSEDYDNHSVMSDNAETEKPNFDLDNNSNHDEDITTRDYISSPGYDTSSSTAPASSPDPCEYTYEGGIEEYKSRGNRLTSNSYSNGFRSTVSSPYSKDSTPERMLTTEQTIYQPRRGSKIEDRLMNFEIKSSTNDGNENVNHQKKDLPKVDILKRRELFEKEPIVAETPKDVGVSQKRMSGDFSASTKSIRDRLNILEKKTDEVKKTNRLSGDITSIKDRLQILEKRDSSLLDKEKPTKVVDVAVPSLKDRLSSLHSAVTKEEVKKPVVLVDENQLENMKKEDQANQEAIALKRNQCDDENLLKLPEDELQIHDESNLDTDREDSGIHTTDVSCSVSQTDEQPELVNIESHHHINEDGLREIQNQPEDELKAVSESTNNEIETEQQLSEENGEITPLSPEPPLDLETSVNEALELALQAIDEEIIEPSIDGVQETLEQDENQNIIQQYSMLTQEIEQDADMNIDEINAAMNNLNMFENTEPIYEIIENPDEKYLTDKREIETKPKEIIQPVVTMSLASSSSLSSANETAKNFVKPIEECKSIEEILGDEEPHYQVPKSSEPYYEVPKYPKPIPVYENIEIFYPGMTNGTDEYLPTMAPPTILEPPKEKPPPPPISDNNDQHFGNTGSGNIDDTYEIIAQNTSPIKRMNSTKRIKNEIRNKRSSFLGIEGSIDDDSFLELTVAPPPDMVQLLQEERRLEKQLYMKAGLYDSSDTGDSRDSGVSENHSRQSSEPFTNSSEEPERHGDILSTKQKELIEVLVKEEEKQKRSSSNDNWIPMVAEADAKIQSIEHQIREQEEVLRVERELLQLEQEELKRQRENLMIRENLARRELEHGAKMLMSANCQSLQDINATTNVYANIPNQIYQIDTDYRKSMSDLQDFSLKRLPPPTPPAKPMRSQISYDGRPIVGSGGAGGGLVKIATNHPQMQHAQSTDDFVPLRNYQTSSSAIHHGNMTRNTLHALSATPKPKYTDGWVQQKKTIEKTATSEGRLYQQNRKSLPDGYNYNKHWLIQEAEQRRINDQQRNVRTSIPNSWTTNVNIVGSSNGSHSAIHRNGSSDNKPLPDAIIQTLTQRVQNKGIGERKRLEARSSESLVSLTNQITTPNMMNGVGQTALSQNNSVLPSENSHDKILSVSGKKKCSHCGDELGRGAAMIIESLRLFFHINCFKCCVCHVQLGDGLNGTDVRVRNHKLHCQNCYSSDDGIKFSCV